MLLFYAIVAFESFYNGAVDIQISDLLTRSQCKVSDTHVIVKACGPIFVFYRGYSSYSNLNKSLIGKYLLENIQRKRKLIK